MKIVRKLLRLLPFIVLIVFFVSFALNFNQYHSELSGNNDLSSILIYNLRNFLSYFNYWTDSVENSDILYTLFIEPFSTYSNSLMIDFINCAFSVLFYELVLSLIFIFFDVFNFMLTIASNWLRKGEKLNE